MIDVKNLLGDLSTEWLFVNKKDKKEKKKKYKKSHYKKLNHSFIRLDGELVALSKECKGVGGLGKVKIGQYEDGTNIVVKVMDKSLYKKVIRDQKKVLQALGHFRGMTTIKKKEKTYDKSLKRYIKDKGYLGMKFIRGEGLHEELNNLVKRNLLLGREIDENDKYLIKLIIAYKMGEAIKKLHDRNILHCDVKASNCMIEMPRNNKIKIKITDYDFSKLLNGEESILGEMRGTPLYLPQFRNLTLKQQKCIGIKKSMQDRHKKLQQTREELIAKHKSLRKKRNRLKLSLKEDNMFLNTKKLSKKQKRKTWSEQMFKDVFSMLKENKLRKTKSLAYDEDRITRAVKTGESSLKKQKLKLKKMDKKLKKYSTELEQIENRIAILEEEINKTNKKIIKYTEQIERKISKLKGTQYEFSKANDIYAYGATIENDLNLTTEDFPIIFDMLNMEEDKRPSIDAVLDVFKKRLMEINVFETLRQNVATKEDALKYAFLNKKNKILSKIVSDKIKAIKLAYNYAGNKKTLPLAKNILEHFIVDPSERCLYLESYRNGDKKIKNVEELLKLLERYDFTQETLKNAMKLTKSKKVKRILRMAKKHLIIDKRSNDHFLNSVKVIKQQENGVIRDEDRILKDKNGILRNKHQMINASLYLAVYTKDIEKARLLTSCFDYKKKVLTNIMENVVKDKKVIPVLKAALKRKNIFIQEEEFYSKDKKIFDEKLCFASMSNDFEKICTLFDKKFNAIYLNNVHHATALDLSFIDKANSLARSQNLKSILNLKKELISNLGDKKQRQQILGKYLFKSIKNINKDIDEISFANYLIKNYLFDAAQLQRAINLMPVHEENTRSLGKLETDKLNKLLFELENKLANLNQPKATNISQYSKEYTDFLNYKKQMALKNVITNEVNEDISKICADNESTKNTNIEYCNNNENCNNQVNGTFFASHELCTNVKESANLSLKDIATNDMELNYKPSIPNNSLNPKANRGMTRNLWGSLRNQV